MIPSNGNSRNSNANTGRVIVHAMALGVAAFLEQALYALVKMLIDWARNIHQRRLARRASPKPQGGRK